MTHGCDTVRGNDLDNVYTVTYFVVSRRMSVVVSPSDRSWSVTILCELLVYVG